MINDTAGSSAKSFFPFIFTLFMFVLFCNMVGMLPYSFTVTSHIIVTFMLAAIVFIGVTIIGFIKHGIKYLELFVPKGRSYYTFTFNNLLLKLYLIYPDQLAYLYDYLQT